MRRYGLTLALGLAQILPVMALPAQARITRLEILHTEPAFGGQTFGAAGAYQHITALAHGELDPGDPVNDIIQDLALAPRNANGHVEYTTPVELLKPADMARGNRILLMEINNRGNKLALGAFNEAVPGATPDRNALTGPGDGWLMQQGYTLAWWGWEMDARPGQSRIVMPPVVAHNADGSPVTGVVRTELLTPVPVRTIGLAQSGQVQQAPPGQLRELPPGEPGQPHRHPHRPHPRTGPPGADRQRSMELRRMHRVERHAGHDACLHAIRLPARPPLRADLPGA